MTGFIDGLAQVVVPTHLLALIALGLLAGHDAPRIPRLTLVAFAFGLLAGSILIALALRDPPAALGLLALATIAGIVVAVARPAPPIVKHMLAFATGTALALDSPPQAIAIAPAIAAQFGTGIAALAAVTLLSVVTLKCDHAWQRIAVRIAGSWVAASAVLVLALRLSR